MPCTTTLRAALSACAALALLGCVSLRPSSGDPAAPTASRQAGAATASNPVLGIACESDASFLAAARPLRAERCWIVYQGAALTDGRLDEPKLRRSVASTVPEGWTGFACLDIENEWFGALAQDPSSPTFQRGADNLLAALRIARSVRPEAQWSFYGLPAIPFFLKDDAGRTVGWDKASERSKKEREAIAERAQVIVSACDWVAPTVYDHYPDRFAPEWVEAQKARVRESVRIGLRMGSTDGRQRPVLPFVWHRLHQSNKRYGLELLSNQEFVEGQVLPALEAGAAGVIWWGSDRHMLKSGELAKAQPAEVAAIAASDSGRNDYIVRIHKEKLDALAPSFGGGSK